MNTIEHNTTNPLKHIIGDSNVVGVAQNALECVYISHGGGVQHFAFHGWDANLPPPPIHPTYMRLLTLNTQFTLYTDVVHPKPKKKQPHDSSHVTFFLAPQ